MSKTQIGSLPIFSGLLLLAWQTSTCEGIGDGGDDDPTTFSFHSNNGLSPLLGTNDKPLKPEDVPFDYGIYYTILSDGVDVCSVQYAWKLGFGTDHPRLLPKYADLSSWKSVGVENGWVAIDPKSGRFKFASANRIEDARRVKFIKSIVLGNLTCWQVEVRDGFTYMPTEEETHSLLVMDATNPDRLRYAGYSPMGGYAMRIHLLKDYAYTFESSRFSIADIRAARDHDIKYVKTVPLPFRGNVKCAWQKKRHRLFIRQAGKVLVYDVKDEDDPVLLKILPLGGYGIAVDGNYGFLTGNWQIPDPNNEGKRLAMPQLRTFRIKRDGSWLLLGTLDVQGVHGFWGGVDRGLLVRDGLAVTATTAGMFLIDVSNPRKPRLLKNVESLKFKSPHVYFGGGSGAKDYDIADDRLFVSTRSSVVVFDISKRDHINQIAELSGEILGGHSADFVRYEKGFLYVGQIYNGLCLIDIGDLEHPKYKGSLSAFGEVEYAEPCGDKIYAVSSGLYVMNRYPAEKAELLGYVSTHSHMFGGDIVSNPNPNQNPNRIVFLNSSGSMRKVTAKDPYRPEMLKPHPPGGTGLGQWVGNHLFAPQGGLAVYRIDESGKLNKIASVETKPAISRIVVRGNYVFGIHFHRGKNTNEIRDIIQVFDISDPQRPKLIAKAKGPTDMGSMQSWSAGLFGDFLYLSGWHAGGGWGNFPGIRVYDVSNPLQPKPHVLIHNIPADISVNSMASPQTFYVIGDTLFVADYWTGLHVFDIANLKERRDYKYIATLKDSDEPWSGNSYCTSVTGHGRYIYTTNFGRVDIWEISVPSDVPAGHITSRGIRK
jgi:hypothetical protein